MQQLTPQFSVRKMCKVLGVKERGYYQWKDQQEKRQERKETEAHLVQAVRDAFYEHNMIYGSRKLKKYLENKGISLSEWKVRRIMRENGLYSVIQKKFKPGRGVRNRNARYSEDLLKQDFHTEEPNDVWISDITYIKTRIGWVYLAVVMDLYNREIIGYAVSEHINTELVLRAVTNAIGRHPNNLEGTIFHSDRGTQYTSTGLKNVLDFHGMIQSMSRSGCPYDNSCVESFFACLKKESIYRKEYMHIREVERDIFEYIELFYNRKRIHSTLGYLSPVSFRLRNLAFQTA
jgi:transposase InsO family protein